MNKMEKPVNRLFSNVVKKQLLCCSLALLLCILAYAYQSMSGTGMSSSQAANIAAATISGVVFNDANGNGKRDMHEGGIRNVTVHMYHSDGKLAGTALTDARGEYTFSVVAAIDYQIKLDKAADYTTGSLKGYQLTAVHSKSCDDQSSSSAVLPDSSKPAGPGNYPQITVRGQASGSNGPGFDIGFITSKSGVDDNGTLPPWHYCLPFGDDKTPTTGAQPEQTPTPEGVTPTPGSKPGQVPPPAPKKPVQGQAPKKSASAQPAAYPMLPATGSDPAGHPLP
jgi:hypothetical protein